MKNSDWLVCVHHRFGDYTKGKKYKIIGYPQGFPIVYNDKGEQSVPNLSGYECGKLVTYFDTIDKECQLTDKY